MSSAFEDIVQGYEDSEKKVKPNEVPDRFKTVERLLEAGEHVPAVELISYGFHKLGEKKNDGGDE